MSNPFRSDNAGLHDYLLRQNRLVFQVSITANATPANKSHVVDIPGVVYLRTEGKTSTADAVEDLSSTFTTADDATGVFGVLIDDATVEKLHQVVVEANTGTTDITAQGISDEGRIYLDLNSDQDLSSTDLTLVIELDYIKEA